MSEDISVVILCLLSMGESETLRTSMQPPFVQRNWTPTPSRAT